MTDAQELDGDQRRVLAALLAMQRQSWEQGVTGHALLDLGQHALARVVARDAVTRQTAQGRLAEIEDSGHVNSGAAAEVVRWAAGLDGDDPDGGGELAGAYRRQMRWLLHDCPRAGDGTVFLPAGTREVWSDSVYMVVPALAGGGWVDEAVAQFEGHRRRLFDGSRGLYAAKWDEERGALCDARAWGTGNGWVVAAVARTLHALGPGAGDLRTRLGGHAREVIDACLRHRSADGAFTDVVDDPTTFPEANLAQMLAYALLTGVADGWLPRHYAGTGRELLAEGRRRIDADGFVTGVCGAPHFDRQGTSAEAQAFFLLATAAEHRLDRASPHG
ncbi:unsaturated rhamnogalacturonyl hydrolase [Kineococcus xinjiangensis]|uniref:Unsaturated rhamnogalacturonyl hydrolase n=1 Tax=Kineococcus xinjiangensis TaxID=512762 RepID=A0A2S6IV08_9ACTN|nr:glycoside hydrolase family 88 protein [Kineococcus xinjiangensis]PPK98110.1 unsaturated rhamnogalacturonyl hydrolase [Kineococcus xinjiangensis]